MVEQQTHDRKVKAGIPSREQQVTFSSQKLTFCADCYFGIHSTPVLPQQHIKDPGHSAKGAGGRLHLHTCIHP